MSDDPVEDYGVPPAASGSEPQANLQRLLTHLPADSLAAKLVVAREAVGESGNALRDVLDTCLRELREAYAPPADQEN
jgi:hypothetical protein